MSKNNKKLVKKKVHEREARKRVLEKRQTIRQERKDEKLREEAFEREFSQKQNLGLTKEEIKQKLEHNMKILEALEQEYVVEDEKRKNQSDEIMKQAKESMEQLKQEFEKLQENPSATENVEKTE
jgi:hypothetical protein